MAFRLGRTTKEVSVGGGLKTKECDRNVLRILMLN